MLLKCARTSGSNAAESSSSSSIPAKPRVTGLFAKVYSSKVEICRISDKKKVTGENRKKILE